MCTISKKPALRTLNVLIRPDSKLQFVNWQAKLNAVLAGFKGFISLEFLSTSDCKWMIVERFSDPETMELWRTSPLNLPLMEELKTLTLLDGIKEKTEDEHSFKNGVTEVIIAQINPNEEKAYRAWSAKIHQIEANFPGFQGVYIQSPTGAGSHWITLLQFDTPEHLDAWLTSPERKALLNESNALITSLNTHRITSPFAGWFHSVAENKAPPSVWKQTMIVLLVLYPIVILELKYLLPLLTGMNNALSTFISNAISASLLAFPFIPLAIFLLGWWLSPKSRAISLLGTAFVLLLYLAEIALFWNF